MKCVCPGHLSSSAFSDNLHSFALTLTDERINHIYSCMKPFIGINSNENIIYGSMEGICHKDGDLVLQNIHSFECNREGENETLHLNFCLIHWKSKKE